MLSLDLKLNSRIQRKRRRRLESLVNKLSLYSLQCYSEISVVIAQYKLAPELLQVEKYFLANRSAGLMPNCNRTDLENMRRSRRKTLWKMLQRYEADCHCNINCSLVELGLESGGQIWQEESRKLQYKSKRLIIDGTFPPSQAYLEKVYPLPVQV
ncbi:hypothetical protein LOZ57_006794 [Ophidiomyces ophidiicola]|uniref:uncharacterized protein n=1 Tax=Ophidiomyces ophidiicola TaxID=1387563 RepID=UPI0020C219C8|nr:uncharacterized protein LOZ57_006794 [Ophidiomyces ophidiicola]KAI1936150.1 hypothetical protein LOZ57_006794 [Ophidiomyces ophidiicola]